MAWNASGKTSRTRSPRAGSRPHAVALTTGPTAVIHRSCVRARSVRTRLLAALDRVFGPSAGPRTLVHHGFYFFTPPQWALFRLLRGTPDIDQVFVVHDDAHNPAFKTWREFFNTNWAMPEVEYLTRPSSVTPMADAFRSALIADAVDPEPLAEHLRVLRFRSPASFVRAVVEAEPRLGLAGVKPYAADEGTIDRYLRRLGREVAATSVDLAHLPVGAFLVALHDCIRPSGDGSVDVVLTGESVLDIATSGFLDLRRSDVDYIRAAAALRRALPFFQGCTLGRQWVDRATALLRLQVSEVAPLGPRDQTLTDRQRIGVAAGNTLRLAPWADLTVQEARDVLDIVSTTVSTVEEIAGRERVELRRHLEFVASKLRRGMENLPRAQREEIESKIQGFSVGLDEEIDVEGLVDVVKLLMGRRADFSITEDDDDEHQGVHKLRNLDEFGFRRSSMGLHVANLAEAVFPSSASSIGWPFEMRDLKSAVNQAHVISLEVMQARRDYAPLGDLYLLWLALDGVDPDSTVTLSWIAEAQGQLANPSSVLLMMTEPDHSSSAIRNRTGGLPIRTVQFTSTVDAQAVAAAHEPTAASFDEVDRAIATIDIAASASAVACPRRFALQWVLGESASFQPTHLQTMLFGNIAGAMAKSRRMSVERALDVCNDLWRFLPTGERISSYNKRVIKAGQASASALWVLTLAGGPKSPPALDRAYQAAKHRTRPDAQEVCPDTTGFLPPPVDDPRVCTMCPVKPACLEWQAAEE